VDSIAAESLDLLLVTGPLSVFVRSSALMKTIDSFGEGEVGGNSAVQFLTRSGLTREQLREVRRHRDSVPVPLLLSMWRSLTGDHWPASHQRCCVVVAAGTRPDRMSLHALHTHSDGRGNCLLLLLLLTHAHVND
jgi:hypothetical protein